MIAVPVWVPSALEELSFLDIVNGFVVLTEACAFCFAACAFCASVLAVFRFGGDKDGLRLMHALSIVDFAFCFVSIILICALFGHGINIWLKLACTLALQLVGAGLSCRNVAKIHLYCMSDLGKMSLSSSK